MGTFLNPGSGNLRKALQSQIYVDKTDMLSFLNRRVGTSDMYLCVSRPRRFGKTYAADAICAYYGRGTDARPLFERLKISQAEPFVLPLGDEVLWDTYLGAFDLIRITVTDFVKRDRRVPEALATLQRTVLAEVTRAFPDVDYIDRSSLVQSMRDIFGRTRRPFVVVIDEWDAPLRERAGDAEGQRLYLDFLRDWLKDEQWLALAYMTGILPIKKYGTHSALNMFSEYTMLAPRQFAPYTAFTEDEVEGLCRRYRRDFGPLGEWYDGYEVRGVVPLGDDGGEGECDVASPDEERPRYSLFSPLSVTEAITNRKVDNYWSTSETVEALASQIRRDFDGLKGKVALLMGGGRVAVDTRGYQNDMASFASADDVLTMLVHLGYLAFDEDSSEVYVPNREVLQEFESSTRTREWEAAFRELEESKALVAATWAEDAGKVARLLEEAHDRADNMSYNSEEALRYAILYAYYAAQLYYTVIGELDSGKGYADVAFVPAPAHPEAPALVVELKWDKEARTALDQIRDRDYPARLAHYEGDILLVGISYDRDVRAGREGYKRHSSVPECGVTLPPP